MGLSVMPAHIGEGSYKVPVPTETEEDNNHFRHVLSRFAGRVTKGEELPTHEEKQLKKLEMECTNFLMMKAYGSHSYKHVLSILTDISKKLGMPQVGRELLVLLSFMNWILFMEKLQFTVITTGYNK